MQQLPRWYKDVEPVSAPRLVEALMAIADHYDDMNESAHGALLIHPWTAFPDLRKRCLDRVVAVLAGG